MSCLDISADAKHALFLTDTARVFAIDIECWLEQHTLPHGVSGGDGDGGMGMGIGMETAPFSPVPRKQSATLNSANCKDLGPEMMVFEKNMDKVPGMGTGIEMEGELSARFLQRPVYAAKKSIGVLDAVLVWRHLGLHMCSFPFKPTRGDEDGDGDGDGRDNGAASGLSSGDGTTPHVWRFLSVVTCLNVDESGSVAIVGFQSGTVLVLDTVYSMCTITTIPLLPSDHSYRLFSSSLYRQVRNALK